MSEALETLQQVAENTDYYTAMDATIHVETEDIDFDFRLQAADVGVESVYDGWMFSRGMEDIVVGRTSVYYQRAESKYEVTAARVELGVSADA